MEKGQRAVFSFRSFLENSLASFNFLEDLVVVIPTQVKHGLAVHNDCQKWVIGDRD